MVYQFFYLRGVMNNMFAKKNEGMPDVEIARPDVAVNSAVYILRRNFFK